VLSTHIKPCAANNNEFCGDALEGSIFWYTTGKGQVRWWFKGRII